MPHRQRFFRRKEGLFQIFLDKAGNKLNEKAASERNWLCPFGPYKNLSRTFPWDHTKESGLYLTVIPIVDKTGKSLYQSYRLLRNGGPSEIRLLQIYEVCTFDSLMLTERYNQYFSWNGILVSGCLLSYDRELKIQSKKLYIETREIEET